MIEISNSRWLPLDPYFQLQKKCTLQKITENDVTFYFIHPKDSPKLYQTFLHALMAALRHKASNCLKQIQSGDQGLRDSYFPWYIRKPTPRKMNECPPKKYHFKKAIHLPNISFQRSNTNRPSKWGWQRKTILWDPRFGLSRSFSGANKYTSTKFAKQKNSWIWYITIIFLAWNNISPS